MSQENVNLTMRLYEAWNGEDIEPSMAAITPDFEFWPLAGFLDLKEVYRGKAGWREFWNIWRDAWEEITLTVDRIEDFGEGVAVFVIAQGRGRESGVEVRAEIANIFSFRESHIARVDSYTWPDALEAAGLSE